MGFGERMGRESQVAGLEALRSFLTYYHGGFIMKSDYSNYYKSFSSSY